LEEGGSKKPFSGVMRERAYGQCGGTNLLQNARWDSFESAVCALEGTIHFEGGVIEGSLGIELETCCNVSFKLRGEEKVRNYLLGGRSCSFLENQTASFTPRECESGTECIGTWGITQVQGSERFFMWLGSCLGGG